MSRILNNSKVLVVIIAILLIANIGILVFFMAGKHPQKKEDNNRDRPGFSDFLKKEMKFSPAQLKQYDSLKKAHWKEAKPLFKEMNALKDSFYIHISDPVVSDLFLNRATDSIAANQKKIDLDMFAHFQRIRGLCTEDQKPVFDSLVQDIIKRMMNPMRKDIGRKEKGPDQNKRPDSAGDKH